MWIVSFNLKVFETVAKMDSGLRLIINFGSGRGSRLIADEFDPYGCCRDACRHRSDKITHFQIALLRHHMHQ